MNQNRFIEELQRLNINVTDTQIKQLDQYHQLLVEYNKVMNLTGITEKEEVYLKHFYDSITLAKISDLQNEESLCDIGTGAGFPGMVLKIIFPHLKVTLVDSLNKRINFLNIVIESLELKDIETIHIRAEDFAKTHREKYDIVTARAVASLPVLLEYSIPTVKENKYFIPMKANIKDELENSANAIKVLNVKQIDCIEFKLPIENSNRCLLKFQKIKKTSKQYPRKNSEIKKHAL